MKINLERNFEGLNIYNKLLGNSKLMAESLEQLYHVPKFFF